MPAFYSAPFMDSTRSPCIHHTGQSLYEYANFLGATTERFESSLIGAPLVIGSWRAFARSVGAPQHSYRSRLQGQTSSLFSIAGLPCLSSAAGLTLSTRCATLLLTSLFQIRAKNAGWSRVSSARA